MVESVEWWWAGVWLAQDGFVPWDKHRNMISGMALVYVGPAGAGVPKMLHFKTSKTLQIDLLMALTKRNPRKRTKIHGNLPKGMFTPPPFLLCSHTWVLLMSPVTNAALG